MGTWKVPPPSQPLSPPQPNNIHNTVVDGGSKLSTCAWKVEKNLDRQYHCKCGKQRRDFCAKGVSSAQKGEQVNRLGFEGLTVLVALGIALGTCCARGLGCASGNSCTCGLRICPWDLLCSWPRLPHRDSLHSWPRLCLVDSLRLWPWLCLGDSLRL
jgi:hypothetical protein